MTNPNGLQTHRNNFDGLRLGAALMVLVGHAYILVGESAPRIEGVPLHSLGVAVFFCVSGFLIARSADRRRSVPRFLWQRCVRIMPALVVTVIVTAVVLGPLLTQQSLARYFSSNETWSYFLNAAFLGNYSLPGVFDREPNVKDTVNGSLWTLGVEVCCYLATMAVSLLHRRLRAPLLFALAAGMSILALTEGSFAPTADLCAFFAFGAVLYYIAPTGRIDRKVMIAGGLLAAAGCLSGLTPLSAIALWLGLPILVIGAGVRSTPVLRSAGRFGDLSYGTYLWSYPITQIVIFMGAESLPHILLATIGATGVAALTSWWLIEKPAVGMREIAAGVRQAPAVTTR